MLKQTRREAERRTLDVRLGIARQVSDAMAMPPGGWVRTIRLALGMSTESLAFRMETSRRSVVSLEAGEISGSVQLNTLRCAADALDCDLLYVLVPRVSLVGLVNRATLNAALNEVCASDSTRHENNERLSDEALAHAMNRLASHPSKIWQP